MDKNVMWPWAIKNSICVICWTALAVVFHKWWIAFFALLFMSNVQTKYRNYRVCDKCGMHSPYADSYNEALAAAIDAGWLHVAEGNKDYCPDCRKEME